jgi:hypothetical protein
LERRLARCADELPRLSKSPSLLRRLVEAAHSAATSTQEDVMSNPQQSVASMSAWSELQAEKAFRQASRARRRAALVARLCRARRCGLTVFDDTRRSGSRSSRGVREIPLEAIKGTTEPNRAAQFDHEFRPSKLTRCRWQSVWFAFHRGATLPPISVVQFGDAYAIRDGHHRVSVAKALGVPSIRATVAA